MNKEYSPLRNRSNSNNHRTGRSGENDQNQIKGILTNNFTREDSRSRLPPHPTKPQYEDEVLSANSGPPAVVQQLGVLNLGSNVSQGQQPDVMSQMASYDHSGIQNQSHYYKRSDSNHRNFGEMDSYQERGNKYLQSRVPDSRPPISTGLDNLNPNTMAIQADPYAPSLVYDLLQGKNEWKNIQDIVKLTFKAICDTVKSQGTAVRELERQMQTKASTAEMSTGLSLKANVADVSRTIADVQAKVDIKQSADDITKLLDDCVSKQDLQYMLSNKVSVEELSRILLTKSNVHEINIELSQMSQKVDEMCKDFNKRINQCSLQKDFTFLNQMLEKKADLDFVNDSLSQKANKQSVANALHRKANRSDIDELLQQKADIQELHNIVAQLDHKADMQQLDEFYKIIDMKSDRQDLDLLRQDIVTKVSKNDYDLMVVQVQNQRIEIDQKLKSSEKDVDDFIETMQNEIQNVKNSMIQSLNKKAEYTMLDRLNDLVSKKVDTEYLRQQIAQNKQEINQQIEIMRSDLTMDRNSKDQKMSERVEKAELNGDRALDEIYSFKEQVRQLQDDRKRDIEETADFIKQVTDNQKADLLREVNMIRTESDSQRKELVDRCSVAEVLSIKQNLLQHLDQKVELKEVQNVLNDCQSDLAEQLTQFRQQISDKIKSQEVNLSRLIERKVDHNDMKTFMDNKVGRNEIHDKFVFKSEYDVLRQQFEDMFQQVEIKLNRDQFIKFEKQTEEAISDFIKQLSRKSNIKDVCALLDMKSNTDEVNKALDEIHEEMDKRVVNKTELNEALQEQNSINEALCAENCSARWLWKSGELQNGFAVPWEIQTINTCPENFLWDEDKSMILTVAPGLYEINFGFYSAKQPTIQVLVNGEPILSAVNNSSYVIHHSAGKLKQTGKQHSSGNLTGLTMIDFIALPARARISLSYNGEKKCEGFLGLRKL